MISCFPDLYPDELLYSACARYGDRMRYPNRADVAKELFGSRTNVATVELPNKLDYFVKNLPPGHLYTTDILIDRHTLYPLYAPFLSTEVPQRMRGEMSGSGHNRVLTHLGVSTDVIGRPEHLRFCPSCVHEDRESYPEIYWHRIHQILGVEVCPTHAVFLEASNVRLADRSNPYTFTSAEQSVKDTPPRPLNLDDKRHNILLKLARDAAWLLNWRGPYPGLTRLRDRYFDLLLQQGYAFYGGRLRTRKLLEDFLSFFPLDILEQFRCIIKGRGVSWPQRLVIKLYAEASRHPLRHLLLMTFLERTAEQVFTAFQEAKPFGTGPWPCLNSAADHFKQSVITDCRIAGVCYRKGGHRPQGTFVCSCGFVYVRVGPDLSVEDRFRITRIASYGCIWDDKLRELWHSPIALEEVGRRQNVSRCAIKWQARRLSLPTARDTPVEANEAIWIKASKAIELNTAERDLEARRRRWIDHLNANAGASRSKITKGCESLCNWLKIHDREWREAHLPPKRTPPPPHKQLDYAGLDKKLSEDIQDAARRIQDRSGHPVRVTIASIIREVGRESWISRRNEKFPLTARAIAEGTESMEAFTLRRVHWTERHYSRQGVCPKKYRFIDAGHISTRTSKTLLVRVAIDAALERLKLRFGLGCMYSISEQATRVA
ncbi:MAG TPA: TnsD family Tn7-like transposition protein [Pyrinomonadaceae bacterium]|jgi:hypothetical protein|nr:TnsD family Tn7-like transposition protein [Pyrinomonadaceae bacterium]